MAAMANATSGLPRSLAYMYIETVNVAPAFPGLTASIIPNILFAIPAVNKSAALSPTILPIDSMQPVTIPSTAEGRTTVLIICHFPEPSASEPSR